MKVILPDTTNPANLADIEQYMKYQKNVLQNDPATIRVRRHELNHLLQWANDQSFPDVTRLEPAFPAYLLTARNDGRDKPLSVVTLSKITETVRNFFKWACREYPDRYHPIRPNWIDSLKPRRANGLQSELSHRVIWTLEEILKIAALKLERLADQRDRAAICFLYLSGMRLTAFATLSINCVDITRRRIEQLPEKGVITKNHKAAITTLLPIPELLAVVESWDKLVRSTLPAHCLWYARLSDPPPFTNSGEPELISSDSTPLGRRNALYKGLYKLCKLAGIPYRSPHKLRHGHAVYGIKHARDMKEFKAISQNLMHGSISITDGIYMVI